MAHYDQCGQQVDAQINAENIIIQSASKPNVSELLKRALQLIKMRAYEQAISVLNETVNIDSSIPDVYYYLALASLKGRRPKVLTRAQVGAIEQNLRVACSLNGNQAHYYYLWALVKFDFYVANGFSVRPPTIEELLLAALQSPHNHAAIREMLEHSPVADDWIVDIISREI